MPSVGVGMERRGVSEARAEVIPRRSVVAAVLMEKEGSEAVEGV